MNYAIVFSSENKVRFDTFDINHSSSHEKMAIGLAYSIRQFHKDVDIYCGNFTNNTVSEYAQKWFKALNVNYVNDVQFTNIGNNDSYCFLRTYCKDYFAKQLLGQYDYILYLDTDVVQLNPIQFNFDPTGPIAIKQTMPQWTANYHAEHLAGLEGSLIYNWVDIINQHNRHLFEIDWSNPENLIVHNADVIISNRLLKTDLTVIEQNVGGYHFFRPLTVTDIFHHYDSLGDEGTFTDIANVDFTKYQKYLTFFERVLNIKITNNPEYWIKIAEEHQ